jgi:hypothetical protein
MRFVSGNRWPIVFGILAAAASGPVAAQDFTQGKTAAQLFAGDCAACHKSPQGLAKGGDPRSIASFLREHYTTKPEMADALAAYVAANGRGQAPLTDTPGAKPSRGAASNDVGRSTDGARPRAAVPTSDESKPPDVGDSPKTKPRVVPIVGDSSKPADGEPARQRKPRSANATGDAPKPADDKEAPKSLARPAEDDAAADASKPKPRAASRPDDSKKPDAQVPTGRLNSYARAGSSDKDKVTESTEERVSKLRSYATSGDAAPTSVSALPKAVASPPADVPATGQDSSSDAARAASPEVPKAITDEGAKDGKDGVKPDGAKADANEPASATDDALKPSKPRKSGAADAGKPPRRTDAGNAAPTSPMSFFGRIFSGGAKPRESDPAD